VSLPRNIDLTEHGDFGGNRPISTRFLLPIDDSPFLVETNEEREKWIRIFGRRSHKDQRNDIFDSEEKHRKYWEHTCLRCGKNIKIPWNNIRGVCKECDKDLANNKVPWKKEETESWGRESVFDLR
jgi:hypothetical protein